MAIVIKKAGFEDLLSSGDYYLKALIIGENGAGKTPFAAQWPRPLFALCENGHMSLAQSGTPYADVKSSSDMMELLNKVRVEAMKPIQSRQFQTFVVDTIDSYQKILIQERLRQTQQEGLSGWADWGWLEAKMSALIEGLKSLPMHAVVLMHTKDVEEQVDDQTRIVQRARMKGDIKESVYDNFPLIGLLETSYAAGEGEKRGQRIIKRQLRWQPDPKHPILRDQSTRLPKQTDVTFADSDFRQIFDAISGGLDDLPAQEVIEEIATPEDEALPSTEDVGVLKDPALPRPAAKKTAAKKSAAAKKKAESPKASPAPDAPGPSASVEPAPASEPEQASAGEPVSTDVPDMTADAEAAAQGGPVEDPWAPPAKEEEPVDDVTAFEAAREAKAKAEAKAAAKGAPEAAQAPVETPAPEPAKPSGPGARICGTQPATFVGKHEPVPGCGAEIPPGTTSASVSIVRHKTFLCPECFEKTTA